MRHRSKLNKRFFHEKCRQCGNILGILTVIFLLVTGGAGGQQIPPENYSVKQGLSSPEVYDIIQDDWGYLWFATDHGLSRYDGYAFRNYGTKDGLTDQTILNFFKAGDGRIWCSTFNHTLFSFYGPGPEFKPYRYNDKLVDTLTDAIVDHDIYVAEDGSVYLAYANQRGFLYLDTAGNMSFVDAQEDKGPLSYIHTRIGKGKKMFSYFSGSEMPAKGKWRSSPPLNKLGRYVRSCFLPERELVIYTHPGGIIISSEENGHLRIPTDKSPVEVGRFDENRFWVGFHLGGVKVYKYNGEEEQHFMHGVTVTDMCKDHQNAWWLSTTSAGVFRIRNIGIEKLKSPDGTGSWMWSLAGDNKQQLYVGQYSGKVSKRKHDSLLTVCKAPVHPYFAAVMFYRNHIFFSRRDGFFKLLEGGEVKKISDNPGSVWAPYADSGYVVAWNSKLWTVKDDILQKEIFGDVRIADMVYFRDTLFLATKHGLYYLDEEEVKPLCPGHKICSVRMDAITSWKHSLLIGTRGSGLVILTGNEFNLITTSHGLTSNHISGVYVEDDSHIWVCTNRGVNRLAINKEGVDIQVLTAADGLSSNHIMDVEVMNDTVWLATRKGVCYFNSSLMESTSDSPERFFLRLSGIKVNDVPRKLSDSLDLDHDENRLELGFQAISFDDGSSLRYRYKMKGLDKHWTSTESRKAIYPSLPPGEYEFVLQVIARNGKRDAEVVTLPIIVSSPYWETWWFRSTITLFVILIIYLFFRYDIFRYNRDIVRELMRQLLKRVKKDVPYIVVKEAGKYVKIPTEKILYVKSDGNYIEIHTEDKKHVIRHKIGEFLDLVPDPLEFLRVRRSYIIRIDKLEQKGKKEIVVAGKTIAIGKTYLKELNKIHL